MSRDSFQINGMPYFPGVAVGRLKKGNINGDLAEHIVLISQQELLSGSALPAGIIVVEGVPFSHTMIGLLGLGVATVFVSAEQAAMLEEDMQLLIDGGSGLITNDVNSVVPAETLSIDTKAGEAVLMADGEAVNLLSSVRHTSAAEKARELGARSIGLVRSEFLLPDNGQVPDKAFYLQAFGDICHAATPLTVTFRLLDVAADKMPPWLAGLGNIGGALGLQGVRIYNLESVKAVIEAQIAALAELSKTYSIRVLLPFLVRLEEYDYWMRQVRPALPDDIPIGAMAETPAMVLDIGRLLDRADFVAIGCNDLMQSLFAADRDQAELRHYLDPYAPLLYRLFKQVAEQAGEHLKDIQLCGLMAQMQGVLPVLLGLGYRNFSVDAPFIPYLAARVSMLNRAECETLAAQVVRADTTQQVLKLLKLETDRHAPFLF